MKSNSTTMMTGCRFIHEAVEADQSGNFGEAHAQYTKALGLFASCDDDNLNALGALMGGSREDAEGLLSRSEERALELQAIIAGEQPAATSSGNAHKIDESAEVATFPPVASPAASPVASQKEAQHENDWDCATPRTPKNAAESDQQQRVEASPSTPTSTTSTTTDCCSRRDSVTASPTGAARTPQIQPRPRLSRVSVGSLRASSNFLEPHVAMTPTACAPTKSYLMVELVNTKITPPQQSEEQDGEVTAQDRMDMHLVIKNLDTGAITQLDENLTIFPAAKPTPKMQVDSDALLIKRMIRNLDTGDVQLLKQEPTKKKSTFLSSALRMW